jgi:hypothetical protein
MQSVKILNLSKPASVPVNAHYCSSFLCRLRGLMFRRHMTLEDSLLLVQSKDSRLDSAIHMMFVWFDLAVVWITNSGEVVDVRLAKAWAPAIVPDKPARYVLEMPAGHLAHFQIGDRVRIEE